MSLLPLTINTNVRTNIFHVEHRLSYCQKLSNKGDNNTYVLEANTSSDASLNVAP